ncbi:MAG: outer membrane beta-barrel protein [Bacteroidales bacterium]|nr:outer membrane beta-barrel protein [Bacteroidales bacterium]
MKKIVFTTVILLFMYVGAQAQIAAGGSLGITTSGGSYDNAGSTLEKTKISNIGFNPMAGYFISEDFLAGTYINFSKQRSKTPDPNSEVNSTTTLGFTPFVRYYALKFNKFSLFGQGQVGFSYAWEKTKNDNTTTTGPWTTSLNIGIFPGIAFDINERVQLTASINGLYFGLGFVSEREERNDEIYIERTSNFGIGADLNNIPTTGNISIGAMLKF